MINTAPTSELTETMAASSHLSKSSLTFSNVECSYFRDGGGKILKISTQAYIKTQQSLAFIENSTLYLTAHVLET